MQGKAAKFCPSKIVILFSAGNGLNFAVDNNLAFEIPLNNVSHTTTSKNEVTLEFHQNDDAAVSLIELRFHIPTGETNPDKDTDQVQVLSCFLLTWDIYFGMPISL